MPTETKREKVIRIRVNDEELVIIKKRADASGCRSLSNYIRNCLLGETAIEDQKIRNRLKDSGFFAKE